MVYVNKAGSLLLAAVVSSIAVLFPMQSASAHTFSGDESAAFLATVEAIKIQTALAQENLADSEVAIEHAEHAAEALTEDDVEELKERNERIATDLPAALGDFRLAVESNQQDQVSQLADNIDSLLGEAVSVRIEQSQLNNSTIQALVVADLIDEALEHYGEAVGFEGDMTDMSAMNTTDAGMSMEGNGMSMSDNMTIASVGDHQSSRAFAERAQEIYNQIKQDAAQGSENAVEELDGAFPDFVSAIDSGMPAMDVMNIAHTRLHPNLQIAYNLQVVPEFPLPLLLLLPLLATVVIIGRLKSTRPVMQ
jgi:hypothetical protein